MSEVIHEIVTEIGADPVKFVIEVVQFGILLAIGYFVAFGTKHRSGMVANMLAKRRDAIASRVERATHAEEMLAQAREQAEVRSAAAHEEARALVRQARATARTSRRELRAAADAEALAIRARAEKVLEEERAEMHVEVRDRIVDVVAQATRSLLNEGLPPQEQRQLIQKILSSEIDRIDAMGGQGSGPAV